MRLALALLLAFPCFCSRADWIHLVSGQTLQGEVLSEDNDFVVVRMLTGEIKLKAASVESVEKQSAQEYKLSIGGQLLQQRRYDRGVQLLEDGFALDKTSALARRKLALGYADAGAFYKLNNRLVDARDICEKWLQLDPGAKNPQLLCADARHLFDEILDAEKKVEDAISGAKSLAESGDWNSAILVYERAINLSPGARHQVAGEIANCYVSRAADYAHKGLLLNAAADVESALSYDPALADKLEQFYIGCALPGILDNIARGQIKSAESDIKRVLGLIPANKSVLYVGGRIAEAAGRLPQAADSYARALGSRAASPTPAYIAETRQRVERELHIKGDAFSIDTGLADGAAFAQSAEGPAQIRETENFKIVHFNAALAEKVAEAAEFSRAEIAARLGLTPQWKGKISIVIHRTQAEYTARTAQPEWTGGCSKFTTEAGRMGAAQIHSWQTSARLLKSVLPHEITHLIVNSNLADVGALPRCLHEGFAVMMEPTFRHEYFMNFLRARVKSRDFIPLQDLVVSRDYPRDPEFFYAEGFALLNFIVQEKGLKQAVALIRNASPGQAESELLHACGRKSMDELQADWVEWLSKNERQSRVEIQSSKR